MTAPIDRFGALYLDALTAFLGESNEASLGRAYELGRQAMIKGLGVLDMASLHQAAIGVLTVTASVPDQAQIGQTAAEFFAELLSPFEMSFRGYRAANDVLQRLNESLRQQKEAVEIANRDLEAFSYSVSHDLRAPLRTIAAYSGFLLEDGAGTLSETCQRHVHRIHDAARDMGALIDSLLSLARVTRAEIERAEVDLTELARQITALLRATAPQRNVSIVVDDGLHARGDAGLLRVVLENLLGNAWKFTAKRALGEIRFGRVPGDGPSIYYVRDNGAGFDMAAADKLFSPFQRLHSPAEFEGTGIGLATVQRVIERHGGRVWVESKRDRGTTFYFTLSHRNS